LINHLKKENERLRKLVISYEFKNKRFNIYKPNNNNYLMSNFYFEILQKKNFKDIYLKNLNITFQNTHKNNDKKEMKIIHKDYKTYFSNKNIAASKKMKNVSNISKIVKKIDNKKSKDLKDINMFDNDFSYMRNNRLSKYEDSRMLTNSHTKKERTGSISQRKRKIDNKVNNTSVNSNLRKIKNIINILQQYKDLSSNRSHSKIIKRKKLYNFPNNSSIKLEKKNFGVFTTYERNLNANKNESVPLNQTMKTIESKKNNYESLDNDIYYSSFSSQKNSQINKSDKTKEAYYQKPIINKITIFNDITNFNEKTKQKNNNSRTTKLILGKKKSHNKNQKYINNYTLGV